jgi:zinc transport system permease protein
MTTLPISALILAIGMALAAGLVGCFAAMRRMTLAGDAFSHVALPGMGIALAFGIQPFWGAMAALMFGAFLIWILETRTRIATETVTGILFSTALAVGSLLATKEELMDALFGTPGRLSVSEFAIGLAGEIIVIIFVFAMRNRLILSMVSPEIAHTAKIKVTRINLFYLLTFALTVSLGLRYLGVLLMGSMIIIPAAVASRWAKNLNQMFAIASATAVVSTLAGYGLSLAWSKPTGPLTVSVASGIFLLGLLKRREH